MEKRQIKLGLLGFGSMGRTHAWAVRNLPFFCGENLPFSASVAGVCTTSPEKSARVCASFGIPRFFENEDELIGDPGIDVVDICTPNNCHFSAVRKAILAGKSLLCEKPLGVSPREAGELLALARNKKSVCGMVFNNRWLTATLRAKQLIDEGALGRILRFRASYLHNSCLDPARTVGWKQDRTICGGGVLFDLGSHVIDLMSHLCGAFAQVGGHSQIAFPTHKAADGSLWQTNADEAFDLYAVTVGGAHGTVSVSKISQGANDDLSFEISGEKGALKFSLMEPNWLYFYDAAQSGSPYGGTRGFTRIECVGRYTEWVFPSPKAPVGWLYGHLESMRAFLTAVSRGTPFSPSLEEGAYVQRVMDAAYRSDAAGGVLTEVL